MTPTLNPDYAPWTCVVAGTGITCTGLQDLSYTNEAIGLQCNGQDVYVTGVQRSKFVRWHDLDGRALKTSIQTNFPSDRLTLLPTGDGPAVFLSGGWHKHYVYPVPGDQATCSRRRGDVPRLRHGDLRAERGVRDPVEHARRARPLLRRRPGRVDLRRIDVTLVFVRGHDDPTKVGSYSRRHGEEDLG